MKCKQRDRSRNERDHGNAVAFEKRNRGDVVRQRYAEQGTYRRGGCKEGRQKQTDAQSVYSFFEQVGASEQVDRKQIYKRSREK